MHSQVISIVIPTYNHAHLLPRCIDSLIRQTYTDWEAVIVNNFSDDNTVEVVENYKDPRIRLINFRNNGIIGASRNEGIRNARGEFVAFLDSDDWWQADKLATVGKYLDTHDVIYHTLEIVYQHKQPRVKQYLRPRQVKPPVYKDLLLNGNCIPNSAAVIRKELLIQLNGLDENPDLVAVEDYDLWVRLGKLSDRFVYIPESLGYYWIWGNNMTQASEKQVKRYEAFYHKHLPDMNESDARALIAIKGYNIGRIKDKMGLHSEAIQLYTHALRAAGYITRLKALLLISTSFFKKLRPGN